MVNKLSTKARLLMVLREKAGKPVSGSALARDLGVSRVAIWKGMQGLTGAGYPIETQSSGYTLAPGAGDDFLYPWEFGERESLFRYFPATDSTMNRAREYAVQGLPAGTVITAGRQSAGKGRNGRSWDSRQGGLFCTIIDRPGIALADYCLPVMAYQIAVARAVSSLCGKPARVRWPNDVYVGKRKIAGLITELEGYGDIMQWLTTGMGVNVNNAVPSTAPSSVAAPSSMAISCAEIAGHPVSLRTVLLNIIDEAEQIRKRTRIDTAYAQGNRMLAAEWNSLAEGIGAPAAVVSAPPSPMAPPTAKGRLLARGIFVGVDPAGRAIIKSENDKGSLYFNPGPVSMVLYGGGDR
jgi:BirA family biotin operon repressor/biotin-[acetyl-CoA-carboxylase] ligase